jgi:mannose/cellobiose epimerase-like protein (N-acyl-D-glucosamine 2-epimerase family)
MPRFARWQAVALIVGVAVVLAFAFYGRDRLASRPLKIDAQWHRQALVEGNLAHWLAVAPSANGFLHANVTRNWRVQDQQSTSVMVQSRLIHVLLSGYEVTGDRSYLDAARAGTEFLMQYFRDPLYDGFFDTVDAEGRVVHDQKSSYGNAFAIFALAHAYRVVGDPRYRDAAMSGWRTVQAGLRDEAGGLFMDASRDFARKSPQQRNQNHMMHMFEALLALHEATGDAEALAGAQGIGKFVLNTLLQSRPDGTSYISEWYTERWQLVPGDTGANIDLGHQFEWAFLLSSAAEQGLVGVYSEVGQRIFDYAIKVGYDEAEGGTYDAAHPDGMSCTRKASGSKTNACARSCATPRGPASPTWRAATSRRWRASKPSSSTRTTAAGIRWRGAFACVGAARTSSRMPITRPGCTAKR